MGRQLLQSRQHRYSGPQECEPSHSNDSCTFTFAFPITQRSSLTLQTIPMDMDRYEQALNFDVRWH